MTGTKIRSYALICSFIVFASTLIGSLTFLSSSVSAAGEVFKFQQANNTLITGSGGLINDSKKGPLVFRMTNNSDPNTWKGEFQNNDCADYTITNLKSLGNNQYTANISDNKNDCGPTIPSPITISDPNGVATKFNFAAAPAGTAGANIPLGCPGSIQQGPISPTANYDCPNGGKVVNGKYQSIEGGAPGCESSGFTLSWLMCPIIEGLAESIDKVYTDIIDPLLKTTPLELNNPNGDPSNIYNIWSNFRIYGNVFLVIAVLIIVFAEAIGGGLIEAYTARKVLPRVLVAAILINLSIYLVAAMVDVTNVLGKGINQIITTPFESAGAYNIQLSGVASFSLLTAITIGPLAALFLGGPLFVFLFFSVFLPMFLAFIAIVATLLIRRGLILFLILIAPIAFALYVLPNTEKYFRQWWEVLFKTLLVYPIIMTVFAIANVLAVTINATGRTSDMSAEMASFLSLIAFVLPLFAIPFAFRLAGGTLGRLYGAIAGAQQKIGGLAESRKERAKQALGNRALTRQSSLYNRLGNTEFGQDVLNAENRLGKSRVGSFARRRIQSTNQRVQGARDALMKDPRLMAVREEDYTLEAITYTAAGAGGYARARQEMTARYGAAATENAIASAKAAVGNGNQAAAVAAAQLMADTGTSYTDSGHLAETLVRASGGNASTAAGLAGYTNSINKKTGRYDLSPGFGNLNDVVQQGVLSRDPNWKAGDDTIARLTINGSRAADPVTLLRGKKNQVKNLTSALTHHLETNYATMSDTTKPQAERQKAEVEVKQTLGLIHQYDASKGYASQENQLYVNDMVKNTRALETKIRQEFESRPNGARDLADIERLSATPRGTLGNNDPNIAQPTQPPPQTPNP